MPDFFHGAGLVNIDFAETQVPRPIYRDSFHQFSAGRRRNIDAWDAQFFEGHGHDAGCRRRAHIAQSHHGGVWFFLRQHGRVLFKSRRVLTADSFEVIDKGTDPHVAKTLFNADEHFAVVAEAEFRVVIEKDLALLQFLNADPGSQLYDRPLLESPRIQQGI